MIRIIHVLVRMFKVGQTYLRNFEMQYVKHVKYYFIIYKSRLAYN